MRPIFLVCMLAISGAAFSSESQGEQNDNQKAIFPTAFERASSVIMGGILLTIPILFVQECLKYFRVYDLEQDDPSRRA